MGVEATADFAEFMESQRAQIDAMCHGREWPKTTKDDDNANAD